MSGFGAVHPAAASAASSPGSACSASRGSSLATAAVLPCWLRLQAMPACELRMPAASPQSCEPSLPTPACSPVTLRSRLLSRSLTPLRILCCFHFVGFGVTTMQHVGSIVLPIISQQAASR